MVGNVLSRFFEKDDMVLVGKAFVGAAFMTVGKASVAWVVPKRRIRWLIGRI